MNIRGLDDATGRIFADDERLLSKKEGKSPSFGGMLENLMKETAALQGNADGEIKDLVAGDKTNVQDVMLAVAKADLSFKMMLEVRNKLLEAYSEVMRMQV